MYSATIYWLFESNKFSSDPVGVSIGVATLEPGSAWRRRISSDGFVIKSMSKVDLKMSGLDRAFASRKKSSSKPEPALECSEEMEGLVSLNCGE